MLETGRTVEQNRVLIRERRGGTDDDEPPEKVINPRFLFSQEVPPCLLTARTRTLAPAEEEDMEPETNYETPPDNENYRESANVPISHTSTTSRKDSGECPSNKPKPKPPAKKKKAPNVEPQPKHTNFGREVKKPDRLIESM
jgi:hypothetical protein